MESSRIIAHNFALNLSDIALTIEEIMQLLLKKKTAREGRQKLAFLRAKIEDFVERPGLSESLRVHLREDFNPKEFTNIMDKLETEDIHEKLPEIKAEINELIEHTWENMSEVRRTTKDIKRAYSNS